MERKDENRSEDTSQTPRDPAKGPVIDEDGNTLDEKEMLFANERSVKKGFWPTLKRALGQLPIAEDVVAAYYCAIDAKTPKKVRITLLGALAYFVFPIDTIPDFLAGIGFADDVSVLSAAIAIVANHIRPEHRAAAREALQREEKPDETDEPKT